jgi:hypothetical protein
VLGQIGNRVQHALRAYTPNDQKDLRAAARSFRVNEKFDTEEVLQALGVGEALVSVLDEKGVPSIVERAGILPPRSSMDAVEIDAINAVMEGSPIFEKYAEVEDRESAYEVLEEIRAEEAAAAEAEERRKEWEKAIKSAGRTTTRRSTSTRRTTTRRTTTKKTTTRKRQSTLEKAVSKTINTTANTIGREIGKKIVRGLFDTFKL